MNNRQFKIVISIVLSVMLAFNLFLPTKVHANNAISLVAFKDVTANHWAYGSIEQAINTGIVEGYEDQTFRPNQHVSAIEFIAMFYRAYQSELMLPESSTSNWKQPYILLSQHLNWDIASEQAVLTRGEVARFVYSVLEAKHTAEYDAIHFMLSNQYSNGMTSASVEGYGANNLLNRAQAVTFINTIKSQVPSLLAYEKVGDKEQFYHEAKLRGVQLGETVASLEEKLGKPNRQYKSSTLTYYTYNADYTQYALYIIKDEVVHGMYSNAQNSWTTSSLAQIGESVKDEAQIKELSLTYYIDEHENNAVEGILLATGSNILRGLSSSIKGEGLEVSLQNVDMTNAFRAKNSVAPLAWDEKLAHTAYNYSVYMYENGHFDHNSLEGLSPFDRMRNDGIGYRAAGENIAMGYRSAMDVTNGWINSLGHRKNLLNESFQYIGVGVHSNYYTQNFIGH